MSLWRQCVSFYIRVAQIFMVMGLKVLIYLIKKSLFIRLSEGEIRLIEQFILVVEL